MKTSFLLTLILMVKKNLSQMSFLTVPHNEMLAYLLIYIRS